MANTPAFGKVVLFIVGDAKDKFNIDENLLRSQSERLNNALDLSFNDKLHDLQDTVHESISLDADNRAIILPAPVFDTLSMSILADFLYKRSLKPGLKFTHLINCYALAARLDVSELANAIIDHFQSSHESTSNGFRADEYIALYEQQFVVGISGLWKFAMHNIVAEIIWGQAKSQWTKKFKRFLDKRPKIKAEAFDIMLEHGMAIHKHEATYRPSHLPEKRDAFFFHVHRPGHSCQDKESERKEAEEEKLELELKAKEKEKLKEKKKKDKTKKVKKAKNEGKGEAQSKAAKPKPKKSTKANKGDSVQQTPAKNLPKIKVPRLPKSSSSNPILPPGQPGDTRSRESVLGLGLGLGEHLTPEPVTINQASQPQSNQQTPIPTGPRIRVQTQPQGYNSMALYPPGPRIGALSRPSFGAFPFPRGQAPGNGLAGTRTGIGGVNIKQEPEQD